MEAESSVDPPRVSVCLPASRPDQYVLEALDSALSQTFEDLEVIVTDDSGGDLEALVKSREDPRIRYFPNPRRLGLAGNHCAALERATGDVIAFLHDDDAWSGDYLAAVLDAMARDERIGMVLVDMEEVDDDGRSLGRRPSGMADGLQDDPLTSFLRWDFLALIPSASVFRREALDGNARPWPDVIAGDLTMYIDAVLAGWKVYHLAEPLVRYRVHGGQMSTKTLLLQTAVISVFGAYSFPDPDHERQRLGRIASVLVARAASHLRAGEVGAARADLRRARRLSPRERWVLAALISTLSRLPTPVFVVIDRVLRGARDRLRRHQRS